MSTWPPSFPDPDDSVTSEPTAAQTGTGTGTGAALKDDPPAPPEHVGGRAFERRATVDLLPQLRLDESRTPREDAG
ncbi:hypothetical protein ACFVT5_39400 [Streptomyces sp. NPDC058001]|uniref:hypothetical protein n=1 Tax=Streptomyces sp. NPDC058001 TaxID=3346300 RepID=UPI0036E8913B